MEFNEAIIRQLAEVLQKQHGFATQHELNLAVSDVLRKTQERTAGGKPVFSLSKMIRGLRILNNQPSLNSQYNESDVAYVRALSTGSTPGSYLVPTLQANDIIAFLTIGGVARSAGVRIWDMQGVQKLNVPAATAAPTWEWLGENTAQTASDPNLGQMQFDLKERRCLIAVPNQLLNVSVPAFDTLLAELIGLGAASHEDVAFFSSTNVSGAPGCLMQAAGITTINANNNNANGGNLLYSDLLAVLAKASSVKAKPPFIWWLSGRTMYQRIMGLTDAQSRPIFIPVATQGLYNAPPRSFYVGQILGWPAYVTPAISETEAVGSGSNQSHLIFTNPSYCHVGQNGNIEMAVSTERYFEVNQTAVRAVGHEDFGFSPAAGIIALTGIN